MKLGKGGGGGQRTAGTFAEPNPWHVVSRSLQFSWYIFKMGCGLNVEAGFIASWQNVASGWRHAWVEGPTSRCDDVKMNCIDEQSAAPIDTGCVRSVYCQQSARLAYTEMAISHPGAHDRQGERVSLSSQIQRSKNSFMEPSRGRDFNEAKYTIQSHLYGTLARLFVKQ